MPACALVGIASVPQIEEVRYMYILMYTSVPDISKTRLVSGAAVFVVYQKDSSRPVLVVVMQP